MRAIHWFLLAVVVGVAWALGGKIVDRYFPEAKTSGGRDQQRGPSSTAQSSGSSAIADPTG